MKQSTPRKGTKTVANFLFNLYSLTETIHTPQGDENAALIASLMILFAETIHTPQGGENYHATNRYCFHCFLKQSTPRKGTKTGDDLCNPYTHRETIHTPQGDENCRHRLFLSVGPGNNPHPARGRKQDVRQIKLSHSAKQSTPRKGTKTLLISFMISSVPPKQFTPRKGTKTCRKW